MDTVYIVRHTHYQGEYSRISGIFASPGVALFIARSDFLTEHDSAVEIISYLLDRIPDTAVDDIADGPAVFARTREFPYIGEKWEEEWLNSDFLKQVTEEGERALRERLREDPALGPTLLREIDEALPHEE